MTLILQLREILNTAGLYVIQHFSNMIIRLIFEPLKHNPVGLWPIHKEREPG